MEEYEEHIKIYQEKISELEKVSSNYEVYIIIILECK